MKFLLGDSDSKTKISEILIDNKSMILDDDSKLDISMTKIKKLEELLRKKNDENKKISINLQKTDDELRKLKEELNNAKNTIQEKTNLLENLQDQLLNSNRSVF